jgi:predicted molibdopterin-dependent oxidoreductase YjgC
VLVDLNPNQWQRVLPAIDAVIRRRINAGAKLIVINSSEPKIASVATVNLIENEASALMSLTKALMDKGLSGDKKLASAVANASVSEAVDKAAALYTEAKNPVILSSPAMYQAAANISLLKGIAVSVPVESNAKGVVMMGLTTEDKPYKEMVSGGLNLLYVIGEVPLNKRPDVDFLVVQNSHLTELAKQADVVLPSAAYLEIDGTMVDYLGRLKHVCKAVEPAGEAKSHREIFADIAKAMGAEIKEAKESETKKLAKVKVKTAVAPFARKEGFDVKVDEMIESINASVINGSRLLWLKEAAVCA